jgi:drug/metabolite transporter (DMT)-like permease
MEFIGPFAYTGLRFALGALSMLPLLVQSRGRAARRIPPAPASRIAPGRKILGIAAAGLILFSGSALQQLGLVTTTAGNAGFITCLYVVLVPLFGIFMGRQASPRIWIGAILALGGLYILSVGAGFTMAPGDVLVLVGSFFWAFHILIVARLANRMDPLELAFGQYLICSALSLVVALATEPHVFAGIIPAAIPILYGGILSIGLAFTLQIIAQKTAHPAHASIILSMESLFAAIGGVILLGEPVTARLVAGGTCMLAGMLVSQSETETRPA